MGTGKGGLTNWGFGTAMLSWQNSMSTILMREASRG